MSAIDQSHETASRSPSPTSPTAHVVNPSQSDDDNNATSPSLLSTLTYPVSYTFSGLLRRISIDEAPTPLAKALSANYNGIMTDPNSGVYQPPKRHLSPFQPPALTALTLDGYKESTRTKERLLTRSLAEEIRLLVPPRMQLVDTWRLAYSLEQDGASLGRLYGLCDEYRGKRAGFVLVVRDGSGMLFGAYMSDPPHPQAHYFGTGECFLWRAVKLPAVPDLADLPPPPSEDTTHATRMTTIGAGLSRQNSEASVASLAVPSSRQGKNGVTAGLHAKRKQEDAHRVRFKAFPYTGENDYTIYCKPEFLSLGGGNGKYGLWLDDRLVKGVSGSVPTFHNECLSDDGDKFDVLGVELWYIGS